MPEELEKLVAEITSAIKFRNSLASELCVENSRIKKIVEKYRESQQEVEDALEKLNEYHDKNEGNTTK